ncbi:LpqB family beta-propeller domain-containing protein [Arthrobacter sp. zg-Y750]|uniref:LpqB family beta-propeller domain-containing protein n=1 Tax=Arthrobacter sp. zg-Y750 TaxID=2894189 RepID=UPI001E2D0A4C|nr:LpqB family beta-propeller domain-containing protein [Arthrobacter sp. zg-Y750]MCC9176146.1 LpqB family beta-propeller domain-containing protein [Arthrobacter sp. zg-Y750]
MSFSPMPSAEPAPSPHASIGLTAVRGPGQFARLLALVLGAALALAGCSSIPTVGPVGTASAQRGDEQQEEAVFSPEGPAAGATAQETIRGFMEAGKGAADDYSVARQFLSPGMAETWSPAQRATVYRSSRVVATPDPNLFQIQLEVQSTVDIQGIRIEAPAGSTESIPVQAEKVDGEWRLTAVPDGIMLSLASFPAVFMAHNLYFYSSDYEYWVPDTRWFIRRAGIAANIVNAVLVGPAPHLQGAVVSAFPSGTELARDAVPVASGEATVDLAADSLSDATDLNRQQMTAQLQQNLRSLNNITSVAMTEGGHSVDLGKGNGEVRSAIADPSAGATQIVVYQGELAFYGDGPTAVEGVPSVAGYGPRSPATSADGATIAFLDSQEDTLLVTGKGQEVRVAAEGARFTAPSVDPKQWVWTTQPSGSGTAVLAIPPGGNRDAAAVLSAPWLEGLGVTELRVSRDGTRVLVAAAQGGNSSVMIAGIVRSAEGVPVSLTTPATLQVPAEAGAVDRVKWASEDTVVAVRTGAQESVPVILGPGREAQLLAPKEGILGLSAGNGTEDVFIQTDAGIFNKVGSSWALRSEGVRDPAFPG